jgi:hypothetical protein
MRQRSFVKQHYNVIPPAIGISMVYRDDRRRYLRRFTGSGGMKQLLGRLTITFMILFMLAVGARSVLQLWSAYTEGTIRGGMVGHVRWMTQAEDPLGFANSVFGNIVIVAGIVFFFVFNAVMYLITVVINRMHKLPKNRWYPTYDDARRRPYDDTDAQK